MLLRLVTQMSHHKFDASCSTISPSDAALEMMCRFYGPGMAVADLKHARLHTLLRLPLVAPGGGASKKALLVHCAVMSMMAAKVAVWVQEGSLPAAALLELLQVPLGEQLKVGPCMHLSALTVCERGGELWRWWAGGWPQRWCCVSWLAALWHQ
jgi:hypothetical protein